MASWRRRQRGGRAETVRLRLDAASNNSILNAAPYNTGQNQRLLLPLFLVLPSASQLSSLGAIPRLFIGSCLCASPSAAPALGPPTRHPLTTYPLSAVAPRQHTHTHTHTTFIHFTLLLPLHRTLAFRLAFCFWVPLPRPALLLHAAAAAAAAATNQAPRDCQSRAPRSFDSFSWRSPSRYRPFRDGCLDDETERVGVLDL